VYLRFILRHQKNIIILRRRRRYVQTSSANNDTYCSDICRFVAVFLLSSLSIISVIVNVVLSTAMVVCAGPTWRRKKREICGPAERYAKNGAHMPFQRALSDRLRGLLRRQSPQTKTAWHNLCAFRLFELQKGT